MLRADSVLGRITKAARPGPPLVRVTAPPRIARLLIAAGAQAAPSSDSMTVAFPSAQESRPSSDGAKAAGRRVFVSYRSARQERQQLASALLEVRSALRSTVSTLRDDLNYRRSNDDLDGLIAPLTSSLRHARELAEDLERPSLTGVTVLHVRTYNEARKVGDNFREGTPTILDLREMDDQDARRMVDFSAGLIYGLHGSITRVTNKVFLLVPASKVDAALGSGGFIRVALDFVSERPQALAAEVDEALRAQDWQTARNCLHDLRSLLRTSSVPLDLSGADLTGLRLTINDLAGAYWNRSTVWPDDIAEVVRGTSEELKRGIYQVRGDEDEVKLVG